MPTDVDIRQHAEGLVLPVRIRAGGRLDGLTAVREGTLCISVTQVAEQGKANKAVAAVLAKLLGCGKQNIELIAGGKSVNKRFLVRECETEFLEIRIRDALSS